MQKYRVLFLPVYVLGALFSIAANAEIYKWVDESGKVHYSSKLNSGTKSSLVQIKDKYSIKSVPRIPPITYTDDQPPRPIAVSNVTLALRDSESEEVRIGRVTCGRPIDLYWTDGYVDLKNPAYSDSIAKQLERSAYDASSQSAAFSALGALTLNVTIKDIKLTICEKKKRSKKSLSQNGTYVAIEWDLIDPHSGQSLYKKVTEGSHNANTEPAVADGTNVSIASALSVATDNLISNVEFGNILRDNVLASGDTKKKYDDAIELSIAYGHASSNFHDNLSTLKSSSVTVETEGGHGSGVFITRDGYLITNAHVIGKEKKFKISTGHRIYNAELVRKDDIRDVALLKTQGESINDFSYISKDKPDVGENIFVIGTPLDTSLSHTVTKGIISANRNIRGLDYFQTDAAINRGNSGGPVFNEEGELVALTVAGMFTSDGASLNLNYLIPIEDVLTFLSINHQDNPHDRNILSEQAAKIETPLFREAAFTIIDWLDKPMF